MQDQSIQLAIALVSAGAALLGVILGSIINFAITYIQRAWERKDRKNLHKRNQLIEVRNSLINVSTGFNAYFMHRADEDEQNDLFNNAIDEALKVTVLLDYKIYPELAHDFAEWNTTIVKYTQRTGLRYGSGKLAEIAHDFNDLTQDMIRRIDKFIEETY